MQLIGHLLTVTLGISEDYINKLSYKEAPTKNKAKQWGSILS